MKMVASELEKGGIHSQQSSFVAREEQQGSQTLLPDGKDVEASNEFSVSTSPRQPRSTWRERGKRIRSFLIAYHLPLMLVFGVIIGVAWPLPGQVVGDAKLNDGVCLIPKSDTSPGTCVWATISSLCVSLIFLISGLQLKLARIRHVMGARKEIALGMFLIFLLTAAFGFAIAAGPKLNPPEFSFGLALFCIMPTTLSSCVVIVGYAGGNVALALFLSVLTNLLGTAILPLTVSWLVDVFIRTAGGSGSSTSTAAGINAADLCISLVFTVLIPLIVGLAMRYMSPKHIGGFIDRHPLAWKLVSALALAMIPWMKISQSADTFRGVPGGDFVIMLLCAFGLHFLLLVLCYVCSVHIFSLKGLEEEKCLVIVCAQKTLPISLSVIDALPVGIIGSKGLIAIPVILAQLFQTIFDSFLAVKWHQRTTNVSAT